MGPKKFVFSLEKFLKILDTNSQLLEIKNGQLVTPLGDIVPILTKHKNGLPDQKIDFGKLTKLAEELTAKQSIGHLNHIGFCYKTASNKQEKSRLVTLTKKTKFHLYEEPSIDDGLWLFLGNADQWEKPMIELIPVEKTNDKRKEFWLPHVQIDIDTKLSAEEITSLVQSIYGNSLEPHSIIIAGITYIVRFRLGVIDGINIFLDLATKARNVEYHRKNILVKLT